MRTTSPEIKRRSRHFEAGWDDVSPSLSLSRPRLLHAHAHARHRTRQTAEDISQPKDSLCFPTLCPEDMAVLRRFFSFFLSFFLIRFLYFVSVLFYYYQGLVMQFPSLLYMEALLNYCHYIYFHVLFIYASFIYSLVMQCPSLLYMETLLNYCHYI